MLGRVSPSDADNRRSHDRILLLAKVEVQDATSGEKLGVIEDLSLGGFRLSTPKVIAVGVRKELRIALPAALQGVGELRVVAECRWLRTQAKGPGFACGFEFTSDNPPELQGRIGELLHGLG